MLSIEVQGTRLDFEHSLVSLSKWEGIHKKPFFAWDENEKRTLEEMQSYFECMLISPGEFLHMVREVPEEDQVRLVEYINSSRSATNVREAPSKAGTKENVTSELIYFWMTSFGIDWRAENWHLSRLLMLIRVHGAKNSKPEKQAPSAVAQSYREINAARRAQLGSKG